MQDVDLALEFAAISQDTSLAGASVRYWGEVPYSEVPAILSRYDIGISLYRADNVNQYYCSPCKVFEYFAAGLAVITSAFPGMQDIVEKDRLGLCVQPDSPEQLAQAITNLSNDADSLRLMQKRARRAFESQYNYECQVAPLLNEIEAT